MSPCRTCRDDNDDDDDGGGDADSGSGDDDDAEDDYELSKTNSVVVSNSGMYSLYTHVYLHIHALQYAP